MCFICAFKEIEWEKKVRQGQKHILTSSQIKKRCVEGVHVHSDIRWVIARPFSDKLFNQCLLNHCHLITYKVEGHTSQVHCEDSRTRIVLTGDGTWPHPPQPENSRINLWCDKTVTQNGKQSRWFQISSHQPWPWGQVTLWEGEEHVGQVLMAVRWDWGLNNCLP